MEKVSVTNEPEYAEITKNLKTKLLSLLNEQANKY